MKHSLVKISAALSVWAITCPALTAEEEVVPKAKPIVVKERPEHSQLDKAQKKQKTFNHERKTRDQPRVEIKKKSILERSAILSSGSQWAMVPKGSVIYVPEHLKKRIIPAPKGSFKKWSSFLRKNGGWIHTHEVTLKQAYGKEYLDEDQIKAYKTMGQIVIATYQGSPTTVTPEALVPPKENVAKK